MSRAIGFLLLGLLAAGLYGAVAFAVGPLLGAAFLAGSCGVAALLLLALRLAFPA